MRRPSGGAGAGGGRSGAGSGRAGRRVRRDPVPMSELADKALKDLAGREREPLLEVLAVWDVVVGERIAKVARPVRFSRGVVTVSVESPVWSQQLAMMAPSIVSALNEEIGKDTVRELRFSP